MTHALSYPVGRFDITAPLSEDMREPAIDTIAALPTHMRAAVDGLSPAQIDTPYRPGGWTVRQLVHHVADSHMNGFIRLKLGMTEDTPTVKPYDQDAWAALADARLPIDISLGLLDGIHARWTVVWRSLEPSAFARMFHHPEIGPVTLDRHLQLYAWHSRHHVAHITALREREHW
jgi:hypothetical protein